ncbi:serine/threonine-protein phosphatase 7 long form-like protein [Trifolium medium]|uniref:Serine/threonine-protein phosphatase 7 long form-like protein n=1 Tax=Trifolium medium TaxID=97028 RepID=A0A392NR30_9FABA|nr:serine/threonine-protein phosphatase 7 long form-like protein [Trifolium medium]
MWWTYKQGSTKLPEYRPLIDALTPDDVIWLVPYLPERCLRQFRYLQSIPPPPPPLAGAYFEIDSNWIGYDISVDHILQSSRPARYFGEITADYLQWYYRVSHPRLCRHLDGSHGASPVPQYAPPPDAPPAGSPPPNAPAADEPPEIALQRERRWRGMIHGALESWLSRVDADRDDEEFGELYFALDVARGTYRD